MEISDYTVAIAYHETYEQHVFVFSRANKDVHDLGSKIVHVAPNNRQDKPLDDITQAFANADRLYTLARCAETIGPLFASLQKGSYGPPAVLVEGNEYFGDYAYGEYDLLGAADAKGLANDLIEHGRYTDDFGASVSAATVKRDIENSLKSFGFDRIDKSVHKIVCREDENGVESFESIGELIVEPVLDWFACSAAFRHTARVLALAAGKATSDDMGCLLHANGRLVLDERLPKFSHYSKMLKALESSRVLTGGIAVSDERIWLVVQPLLDNVSLLENFINLNRLGNVRTLRGIFAQGGGVCAEDVVVPSNKIAEFYEELVRRYLKKHVGVCQRASCRKVFFSNTKRQDLCSKSCRVQKSEEARRASMDEGK
ncbi:hypothetical protein B5F40_00685 [Gordonibacter sp. An230]|uniref:hypothetical protein n=1 Tax=Gordonibacter sp. An230 TaxID=1965592 RepID=UPI000B38AB30|nr:hypothetical protein [Gordonibacter sp. An230]OUO92449.1 hypothetical protein B5F40_00685 [Gordonibacter sp. An230]HIY83747.1 hypothetical protein [Candidatus Rubneribacter avistercoris]